MFCNISLLSFHKHVLMLFRQSCVFVVQPDNVLLTSNKVLKLADFGLAISINQERPNTRAGTLGGCFPMCTQMLSLLPSVGSQGSVQGSLCHVSFSFCGAQSGGWVLSSCSSGCSCHNYSHKCLPMRGLQTNLDI